MESIKLDLVPGKKMPSLHASQFDDGRAYHIDLTENNVPYKLDGTETISVIIRKCDNTLVSMDIANTFANKSYLEFEVTEQMTACGGFNYGEIILEKNGDRLGSLNFYLVVETAPDENGITSQSDIKNLERQVHDIVVEELADNGAEETGYDNTESGLDAANVQDALDELAQKPSVDAYTKTESDAFITDEYSAESTYAVGDMVIHENALYVCSTAITTAEAWNSSHWTLTDIATAIGTVKTAIPTKTSDLQNDSGFAQIDDSTESASKTYSSEKIEAVVGGVQSEVSGVEALLNFSKGDSKSVSDSFVGYQRKTVFANVELQANKTYYFRIEFASASDVQGYYAVSKTDNTTPDYAFTNLLNKKTADFTYTPSSNLTVNITARFNVSGTYSFDCSYAESKSTIYSIEDDIIDLQTKLKLSNSLNQPFKYKKRYDHLFSTRTGANCTIPMQSLFHVRLSKKFGFDVIEGNVNKTSDGKYFVHHMAADDKFGTFFHHVDGVTDISNIACTSVTWDWIAQNVRYNSSIEKYQTRPCTLEEFLGECRQQELMPMLEIIDLNVVAIADKILGKGNYIAYGGTRALTPNAIMYQWKNLATKQEILDYCDTFGTPMIYGMALPTRFTDEELQDIIDSLHEKGYQIGVSYVYEKASDYFYKGVDVDGSQYYINRILSGNLCNYDATFGFDDFVFTNATETDGVLTYSSNGTFAPDIANTVYQFCAIDIELVFNGTISVPAIGEASAVTITSDGTKPCYFAIPIINGSPLLTISVNSGTQIIDAKFKASVV